MGLAKTGSPGSTCYTSSSSWDLRIIYTTTIDDFGSNVDRTSVRINDEWAKALDDDDDEGDSE